MSFPRGFHGLGSSRRSGRFLRADGKWVEVSGGGNIATDTIWDAAGDTVYATGADAATRLPIGTAGQVLKVNAGATAPEWGAGGSGDVATDTIWDAAGDLAVGTGSNAAARLAIGSAGEVLTVAGGTASWEPASGGSETGAAKVLKSERFK